MFVSIDAGMALQALEAQHEERMATLERQRKAQRRLPSRAGSQAKLRPMSDASTTAPHLSSVYLTDAHADELRRSQDCLLGGDGTGASGGGGEEGGREELGKETDSAGYKEVRGLARFDQWRGSRRFRPLRELQTQLAEHGASGADTGVSITREEEAERQSREEATAPEQNEEGEVGASKPADGVQGDESGDGNVYKTMHFRALQQRLEPLEVRAARVKARREAKEASSSSRPPAKEVSFLRPSGAARHLLSLRRQA